MLAMTSVCWWAFTYKREGFIPQMYGSMRACCSATTDLDTFGKEGTLWGDREYPDTSFCIPATSANLISSYKT